jgi:hypothetical protein
VSQIAVIYSQFRVCKALIDAGADPYLESNAGLYEDLDELSSPTWYMNASVAILTQ